MPNNITNITPPRVPLVDTETGIISREWYRFFVNMFTITGGGSTNPILTVTASSPLYSTGGSTPNISVLESPLTSSNDTNVTLTLDGDPTKSLLNPVNLSLGWQGVLSQSRGGTGPWATAGAVQVSLGSTTAPSWSNVKTAFGYIVGAGVSVVQTGTRTNAVVADAPTGQITMVSAAGSATPATFTVTNSTIESTDVAIVSVQSGASNSYMFQVSAVTTGSFNITFWAQSGTAVDAPVLNFAVIKGAVV